jgi:hypothetical protein
MMSVDEAGCHRAMNDKHGGARAGSTASESIQEFRETHKTSIERACAPQPASVPSALEQDEGSSDVNAREPASLRLRQHR